MTTSTLRRLALPCALAFAAGAAGASQITGTGIGASNHPTIAGTSTQSTSASTGATNRGAKGAAAPASSVRK